MSTKQEILEKRLRRAQQKVNILERLIEDKTRNLYLVKEALQKAHNELEQRVEERTTQLAEANEQLKQKVVEHRRAEEALRQSEERYRRISDAVTDYIYTVRIEDGHPVETIHSPACVAVTGYTAEEFKHNRYLWIQMVHEEDRKAVQEQAARSLSGVKVEPIEHRLIRKDGATRWVRNTSVLHYDSQGKLLSYDGLIQDVTDRKLAEEALRQSEERHRSLLESSPDPIVVYDMEGRTDYVNSCFVKTFGWSQEELLGKRIDFVPAENMQETEDAIKLGQQGETIQRFETKRCTKDGRALDVSISSSFFWDKDGRPGGNIVLLRDVTETKKLEARLHEAHKMETIATLAGGIAHDFNNALSGIVGNIELLKIQLPNDQNVLERVQPMFKSAQRMANLTDQLLAYARGGKYQSRNISLSELVQDTIPLIQHTIDPAINIKMDLADDPTNVDADVTQMQMVVSAAVTNATEAMEGSGCIKISLRNEVVDEDLAKLNADLNPGSYACLTVEDDGKGMDEETASKVFEPFFTTKVRGRGLGMAAAYGIVKNHDGWISIDSQVGKGTKLIVYLPSVKSPPQEEKEPRARLIEGTGTILVVEDEEVVTDVSRAILEKLGFNVLEASSGAEAVNIVKTYDGNIDLAILDIGLPDIPGEKLYHLIMEAIPRLKVIVCSGYALDGPAQEILNAGAQGFIQKPFLVATLSEKLKEVLK